MDKWQGKVALVTGASKGIGRCLAKTLACYGMKVIACARSKDKLQELVQDFEKCGKDCEVTGGQIEAYPCDLSKRADILNLFKYIESNYRALHVCVNNAGIAIWDYFLPKDKEGGKYDGDRNEKEKNEIYDRWERLIQLDLLATAICAKEAVNTMAKTGVKDGLIINISSTVGRDVFLSDFGSSGYYTHMYCGCKFGVTALTQSLRLELQKHGDYGKGIRVTTVYPGVVETSINDNVYKEQGITAPQGGADSYKGVCCLKPEEFVEATLTLLRLPMSVQVDGITVNPTPAPNKAFVGC